MMKFCCKVTKEFGVKTLVSLNPIMVDGTGMCGCCRVSVGGKMKFACVDGPEFEGHDVDWDELNLRLRSYMIGGKGLLRHVQRMPRRREMLLLQLRILPVKAHQPGGEG